MAQKAARSRAGFYTGNIDYRKSLCPVTEALCRSSFGFSVVSPPAGTGDMDDIVTAVKKVMAHEDRIVRVVNLI